jgi:hypothetical protein
MARKHDKMSETECLTGNPDLIGYHDPAEQLGKPAGTPS